MLAKILTLVFLGVGAVACDGAEPGERRPLTQTQSASGATKSGTSKKEVTSASAKLSFAKDVLPILKARTEGKVYKCTICHPDYESLENVSKPDVAQDIIRSAEEGTMPVGGTKVASSDIAILKKWVKDGYRP
jgi:hypothetical protein